MEENLAKLYCPNPTCQAVNDERHEFCQVCRTPLPKRYLWAMVLRDPDDSQLSRDWDDLDLGEIWCDRYWHKGDRVVLDTRPGNFPDLPEVVPPQLEPYLRLFPYRWHVPQLYGRAGAPSQLKGRSIWLLDEAPIRCGPSGVWILQPSLKEKWADASPLRQLNWLWQMARLWQPCCQEGVASSLLDYDRLRVEGGMVRLSHLAVDLHPQTLDRLGRFWSGLIERTAPPVRDYLRQLCDRLMQGSIKQEAQLIRALERAIQQVGDRHRYQTRVAARTDRGPSRARNEDACYPVTGQRSNSDQYALTLVCDGVGGHEGGDIASNLAIHIVEQHLRPFRDRRRHPDRDHLLQGIQDAILKANDAISDRNNKEQRHGRQRMGTTLVMALAQKQDLYITHIGDSRAYLITRHNCYPITIDDDVASREVRLGYAFYQEALQRPAAGSLIQALGMGSSNNLHPTTTHFVIDEDCICLLCSDGLSDYDRVERIWQREIQPLLDNGTNLQQAVSKLIEIANSQNGHDNVTISLLHLSVEKKPTNLPSEQDLLTCLNKLPRAVPQDRDETVGFLSDEDDAETQAFTSANLAPTQVRPAPKDKRRNWLQMTLLIALLAGILGGVAYALSQQQRSDNSLTEPDTAPTSPLPEGDGIADQLEEPTPIGVGDILRLDRPIELYSSPGTSAPPRTFPHENQFFIVSTMQRPDADSPEWLQLTPCVLPFPVGGWVTLEALKDAEFSLVDEIPPRCNDDGNDDNL
ncbi:MAG: protein phosphatase 2C domain-containing protein [Phormidium sp. BM_Day4_Bin.17]|nr:protein phosphatase 2C domain-containing protein [Phormidium sp. BM_Day4_Bin.17]UCJ12314.1 MAG: protein phosphatase 2C domain-containing protein [Phormidium sp. PBR-2020]